VRRNIRVLVANRNVRGRARLNVIITKDQRSNRSQGSFPGKSSDPKNLFDNCIKKRKNHYTNVARLTFLRQTKMITRAMVGPVAPIVKIGIDLSDPMNKIRLGTRNYTCLSALNVHRV
jgi:hypothetical protein